MAHKGSCGALPRAWMDNLATDAEEGTFKGRRRNVRSCEAQEQDCGVLPVERGRACRSTRAQRYGFVRLEALHLSLRSWCISWPSSIGRASCRERVCLYV